LATSADSMHPLEQDLTELKDSEIESKLLELQKKYFIAARLGNRDLLTQLAIFVNIYKEEMYKRYHNKTKQQFDGDLDQLINVD
jgi:hypothetical protein